MTAATTHTESGEGSAAQLAGKTMAARAHEEANALLRARSKGFFFSDRFATDLVTRLSEPCAIVHSGEESITFVVFLDGSLWMLDEEYHLNDTEDSEIYLESPDALADALAQADRVIAVSSAGLAHAGLDEADEEAMAAWAASRGGDAERLEEAFRNVFDNLEDPLVDMSDEGQSWNQEQAETCEKVLVLALQTDPRFEEGYVSLFAAGPDGDAYVDSVDHPHGDAIAERAWRILLHAVDGAESMRGTQYHYNDGASGRESGYSKSNACVASLHIEQVSAHERVRALSLLRELLSSREHDAVTISAVLAVP